MPIAGVEPPYPHLLTQALAHEAHLLDTHRYAEWLELLDPGVRCAVPVTEWVRDRPVGDPVPAADAEDLAFLTRRTRACVYGWRRCRRGSRTVRGPLR